MGLHCCPGFSLVVGHVCWVTQSCLTFCSPMEFILPGSSVHRISQARILEWVSISFSRECWPRSQTRASCLGMWILHHWAPGKRWAGLVSSCGAWASHCCGFSGCRHGLRAYRLQRLQFLGSRAQAQSLWCAWLVAPLRVASSGSGIAASPELAGRFLITEPPGKPS